jgi:hypothetical protein
MTHSTRVKTSPAGVTLVELIITITVMAVMVLTVVPLFNVTSRGYTSLEVNTVLSAGAQQAVTRMQNRLSENKRLFGNDATGTAFLARVTPSLTSPLMSGSTLPFISANASLSPSSGSFSAANVGNCLLFVSADKALDPTSSVRVDTFVFNFYYLSLNNTQSIGGNSVRDLWEWHSKPYVDYLQLSNISPLATRNAAITALVSQGYLYAFDASTTSVSAAFYQLSAASPWITSVSGHNVQAAATGTTVPKKMISIIRGASLGSFIYSVSPNTGGSFTHKYDVPVYASSPSTSNFPSGFEAMIVGPAGNRRVFARLVMAAKGSFKGFMAYEQVLLVAVRDLW